VTEEKGEILLDGRNPMVEGFPEGNWVGPTVTRVTTDMTAYKWVGAESREILALPDY
jgi:malonate-semialdehyde dehydrogenase (acetylating)/methylmalonate-semialdehyde dehydrogenase